MSEQIIGTCSLCLGPVVLPGEWLGPVVPIGQCRTCGARPKLMHGPVIEMDPDSKPKEEPKP